MVCKWLVGGLGLLASLDAVAHGAKSNKTKACSWRPGTTVKTTSGSVKGHRAYNASQVSEYVGIPYAKPPVGDLRFAAPVAYKSDKDIDATQFGHDCPIHKTAVPTFLPTNVYGILSQLAQVDDDPREDCLNINVWTKPQVGAAKKPVLVWIYGGGFQIGGTNTSAYSGQFWADTEDVVFVNFNYRLNIFGFPGSPATDQNLGLLDQRLAIEWVRDNIEGFGGDPERITIFGQSAGAASVDYYLYAYEKDPIIAGAIMESGTAISFGNTAADDAAKAWYKVTDALGCGTNETASDKELLSCMRKDNITMDMIVNAQAAGATKGLASVLGNFGPTIDDKTVFTNYTLLASKKRFAQVPTIIGNNDYEAGLFKLIAAGSGVTFNETVWESFDLASFTCPASTAALWRVRAGLTTYRYRYFGMFPNLELPTSKGRAWHGAELLPMFSSSEQVSQEDSTWQERAVGSYLRGAWSAFARCPEDGLSRTYAWRDYDLDSQDTLLLLAKPGRHDLGVQFAGQKVWDAGCPPIWKGVDEEPTPVPPNSGGDGDGDES